MFGRSFSLLWHIPRNTTGLGDKIDLQPQKLGAKASRYQPSPDRAQRGKRRRQWR